MATMQESGKAAKTRANALVLLHQLFHFAERNGWCTDNPCARVDRPQVEPTLDIRFLNEEEFEALLEAVDVAREPLGHVDRAMFLTGNDDRPATGGAARAPLARRRLASGEDSRSP
jgi:site-specific recombinase XerD